jgi:DNA-binding transcriptional LysR family regulator
LKFIISFFESMNQIRALETFAKVVELGSFVRAAQALDMSSAGVTRDIAQLEAHLGTRLLQRHPRRLVLTETGASYYERCKQVLADLYEADALASAATLEASGVLRLNAPVAFGTLHLAPLLPQFRALYPKVELDISLSDRFVDLMEENVDMAVRIARLPSSSLVARPISHTCLVACAAPTYLQRRGTPNHPHDLSQHDGLGYSYASSKDEWEFRSPQGEIMRLPVRCTFHANHGSLLHAACLAGAGIALLPSFIVGADLLSGRLLPLLRAWQTEPLGIHVVYPSRKHLSAKVRVMRDFLSRAFPDPPPWENWQTG